MKRECILIVDDNAQNLKLTRGLLTRHGYEVHTAADAEQALKVLDSLEPRIILMDLQLPDMDGLELTRRLKADPSTRRIAIIGLTAFAMTGDEERARKAGCDGYVLKPVDARTLPILIAKHIERTEAGSLN
jgi:two-component system, cell cycle response regulator DivK